MNNVISEERIPIKLWLDDLEEGALEQAKILANLPFAFKHIALMSDCHLGYGMPIGGVMATKGVVVPHAVGSDIGCFDMDTEFLSPTGWKKISKWKNEKVMQFHPEINKAEFIKPLNYIKEKCDKFIHIKTKYGIDQMLSEEHRCLVYKYNKSFDFSDRTVIQAKEIMENHNKLKNGFRHRFMTSFGVNIDNKLNINDDLLRIYVMFSADGSFSRKRCVLQFKKERKIKRAEKLLKKANIEFNKSIHKNGTVRISFLLNIKKGLNELWKANQEQLHIISNEVIYWDGNQKNCFYTSKKEEADFIHYCFSATGKRAVMRLDRGNEYRVFKYDNYLVGINSTSKTKIKYKKSIDGYKYCFTVPSSYLVMRRNSNIFITGNCGMCAVKTSLTDIDTETLKEIMKEIRKVIPVGKNRHKEKQNEELMPEITPEGGIMTCSASPEQPICRKEKEKALYSLGTLGSGNHFIEIQKGNDGHIWIMIHSGSRNLGYTVADYYNNVAKKLNEKWFSSVNPKHDLAFLPLDSEEGKNYMREMQYCVDYALANRKLMMTRIEEIFANEFDGNDNGERISLIEFDEMINIAHNYAKMENHFGQNLLVHRKGATLAIEKTIGIIPGSQGSKSYIVQGKGNKDSFNSCSHGAGRLMSRTQAKKELSLEKEIANLEKQGILHSIRGVGQLDEAPSAYKDIQEVMANQKDLVEILVELTPLAVIKG